MRVDLLLIGEGAEPAWPLGQVQRTSATVLSVADALTQYVEGAQSDALLIWNAQMSAPQPDALRSLLSRPGDVFHAGLALGLQGWPGLRDMVGAGMWDSDPPADIEATSWRVSLDACLVRMPVLKALGGVNRDFETLQAAGLEMGHRWLTRGAIVRYTPDLVSAHADPGSSAQPPFADEARFVLHTAGSRWTRWALLRAAMSGYAPLREAATAWRAVSRLAPAPQPEPFTNWYQCTTSGSTDPPLVTVLIPTVDRYSYLRVLLDQLRRQTVPPFEVIVVDQTAQAQRETTIANDFADLPLRVMYQDEPGQCSSRNAGILASTGNCILFVDDDDEISDTLIADHLANLARYGADVSSGVADEVGAGPLPADFRFTRASNVFPTNNTLMRRDALTGSGLFDLAYNRGQRADGDLGMRLYLSGALMVLDASISVLHHHAPSGGLRKHRARTVTYASSRRYVTHRQISSTTEHYMGYRYFTERQRREAAWLCVLGTFSIHGNRWRKLAKAAVSLCCLPRTVAELRRRDRQAQIMLHQFPQMPQLARSHRVPQTARSTADA